MACLFEDMSCDKLLAFDFALKHANARLEFLSGNVGRHEDKAPYRRIELYNNTKNPGDKTDVVVRVHRLISVP